MKDKMAIWGVSRVLMMLGVVSLAACAHSNGGDMDYAPVPTPTVDFTLMKPSVCLTIP
jgi:hypothetical protein